MKQRLKIYINTEENKLKKQYNNNNNNIVLSSRQELMSLSLLAL